MITLTQELLAEIRNPKPSDFFTNIYSSVKEHGVRLMFAEDQSIEFKPWVGKTHRELSKILGSKSIKAQYASGKLFKKIVYVLQHMCIKFAGREFYKMDDRGNCRELYKEQERIEWIEQQHETDVLLAYILLHMQSSGDIAKLEIEHEGRQVAVDFDLNDITFIGSDRIEDALFSYTLTRPLRFRGKDISEIIVGPISFKHLSDVPINGEMDNYDVLASLAASIHYVPEITNERVVVASYELDMLPFNDIKKLKELMSKHYTGIDMNVNFEDKELNSTFKSYLPWWDSDFLV